MTDETALTLYEEDETPGALATWAGDPTQAWQLADALMSMHPAAADIGIEGMRTVAQLAIMTGANPLPGVNGIHAWFDEKKKKVVTSFGIGFWEGEAQNAGGYLWLERPRPMTDDERKDYLIPAGTIAFICSAALTNEVFALIRRTRDETGITLSLRDAKEELAKTGLGIVPSTDYAKAGRPVSWTARERATRDVLRKLVPVGTTNNNHKPAYKDWSPALLIDSTKPLKHDPNQPPVDLDQLNDDLFGGAPITIKPNSSSPAAAAVVEDGVFEEDPDEGSFVPGPAPEDVPDVEAFFAYARDNMEALGELGMNLAAVTEWIQFVTGNQYDPEYAMVLLDLLFIYCRSVMDLDGPDENAIIALKEEARNQYALTLQALNSPEAIGMTELFEHEPDKVWQYQDGEIVAAGDVSWYLKYVDANKGRAPVDADALARFYEEHVKASISGAATNQFVAESARILNWTEEQVKTKLKDIGATGIPRDNERRVELFWRLTK